MIDAPDSSSSDEDENNRKFTDVASARWYGFSNKLRTSWKSLSKRLTTIEPTGEFNPAPNVIADQDVSDVLC